MALRKKHGCNPYSRKQAVEHHGMFPYLQRYLERKTIEGLSRRTLENHDSGLRRFILWCDERELHDPRSVTKPLLERYQKHLFYYRRDNGKPLGIHAQHALLSILKSFFSWLTRENYLLYNPASDLVLPRLRALLPRAILSLEEITRVFESVPTETPEGLRDRAILELFYSAGLRCSELCGLGIGDVDMPRQVAFIKHGKGDKSRYVPFGRQARVWLERYIEGVRPLLLVSPHESTLFLTDFGEPFKGTYMTGHVKRYLHKAGLKVEGSCHLFRHAMATHMLENGADIRFVQTMLGHDDIRSTQVYTRVSLRKLQEIHAATHPGCWDEVAIPAGDEWPIEE